LLKEEVHDLYYNRLKELIIVFSRIKINFFGMWEQRMYTLGWKSAASGSEHRT